MPVPEHLLDGDQVHAALVVASRAGMSQAVRAKPDQGRLAGRGGLAVQQVGQPVADGAAGSDRRPHRRTVPAPHPTAGGCPADTSAKSHPGHPATAPTAVADPTSWRPCRTARAACRTGPTEMNI